MNVIKNFITAVFDATLTLDTAAHAAGDVLSNPVAIALPRMPVDGAPLRAEITSVQVLDEDAQAQALDLVFLRANRNLGTLNAVVDITDANARDIVGIVPVVAADYKALVASSQAFPQFNPLAFELTAAILYVAAICRSGTPTHTANGVRVRVGIRFHNIEQW